MLSKILIANRGEIAVRVIRAVRDLGLRSVAVYSEADTDSLHVSRADESVCIGPAISARSYLDIEAVIKAARKTGAEAIHPGYGYLAENGDFARACKDAGLVFIGPTPESLYLAGDKIMAKEVVNRTGVPIVPSSPGGVGSINEAVAFSSEIGYPVMVKASAGGGGRGIRICPDEDTLREEFAVAKAEVKAAFGDDSLYIEKCLVNPRHIEFQVLADKFGNVIHLGERECSIQRRYQKLIEEAPSPAMRPELRKAMGQAAIRAAKAVNYLNAGTVEFLLDREGNFYFMEINARIQVEHPVTEMVTGVDLVKEQIRLADGGRLEYSFDDIRLKGWAIECRINAENPDLNFLPSPGIVKEYSPPGGSGIRLDTHLYQGYDLPIYYDSLVAKLIGYDLTRDGAIRVLRKALDEFVIRPVKTTIPLHLKILDDPAFQRGDIHTGYIKKFVPDDDDDDEE
ncbi:acetyl-CoA carboxylase biotin carboxylase subunit [Candidatus Poribacteria bacterium]|nr:acetyl-CoA carboxylase biotin carboxylase subunit [Candidatus Poribacteria bacterium]